MATNYDILINAFCELEEASASLAYAKIEKLVKDNKSTISTQYDLIEAIVISRRRMISSLMKNINKFRMMIE